MAILVTDGAGFVGLNLAQQLLGCGERKVALARRPDKILTEVRPLARGWKSAYWTGGMGVASTFTLGSEVFGVAVAGSLPRMKSKLAAVGRAVVDAAAGLSRAGQTA